MRRAGCPIRTSPDLRLPAPPRGISPRGRVLHRPPTPRHPPCAHHADVLRHVPSGSRRRRDRRPARASGMVPSGRISCPLPRLRGASLGTVCFVCVCVCCSSVRAGDQTRASPQHRLRCRQGLGRHDPPERVSRSPAAAEPHGFRVAHCQGASDDTVVARRERLGGRQTSSEGVSRPRTNFPNLVWSVDHGSWSSDHGWRDDKNGAGLPGGAAGIRTPDLRRARAALSQLSYGPERPPRSPGWARLDSNQGPRPYQGRALTA